MRRTRMIIWTAGLLLFAQAAQAGWTAAKRLTWNAGASECPVIAVEPSDNIHIVWYDDTPGNDEIYYKQARMGDALEKKGLGKEELQ